MEGDNYIVLFDGACNLCNGWVRFLQKRDPKKQFDFVSAQSRRGMALLEPDTDEPLQTVVLLYQQQRFERSDAAIKILQALGGGWKVFGFFKWIPRRLRDVVYNLVAKHRYRWFGKIAYCEVPVDEVGDGVQDGVRGVVHNGVDEQNRN